VRTFCEAPVGQGFWYENSSGLVELAVNQGSAAESFGLAPGDSVQISGEVFSVIREI
jgi:S-adenosylmethionine hydrolase